MTKLLTLLPRPAAAFARTVDGPAGGPPAQPSAQRSPAASPADIPVRAPSGEPRSLVAPLSSREHDVLRLLEAKGHTVRVQPVMGSAHSITRRDDGALFGASDPRRPSALTAGY